MVFQILGFDSQEQGAEPLKRSKVTTDPEKVYLPQPGTALWVVHAIPDTLQDRRKRRDTNTRTDEHRDFELEYVFRGGAEGAVDIDSGQNLAHGDFFAVLVFLAASFLVEVTSKCLTEFAGEVAHHADVDGNVVLFGCRG